MEYVNLGKTGLKVSKICLGCMGFGELDRGGIPGKTAEKEAREIIKYALEHGINFFDTANYYSLGASEEILGQALKDYANREDVVIATITQCLMVLMQKDYHVKLFLQKLKIR